MELYYTDVAGWDEAALRNALRRISPSRAARAREAKDPLRQRLIAAAGLLLRDRLGCGDEDLRKEENGKPYLPGGAAFNLTHGGTLAAIVIAAGPCGVDTEPLARPVLHPERLFCPEDLSCGYSPAVLWTRLEALGKADGRGVALSRQKLPVSGPTAVVAGREFFLQTWLLGGQAISCAAKEALCTPVFVARDALLG